MQEEQHYNVKKRKESLAVSERMKTMRKVMGFYKVAVKQVFIILISIMMLINLMPLNMIEVKAADDVNALRNVQIEGYTFITDGHGMMAYRKMPNTTSTYDIFGKYEGKWIRTTYQYSNESSRGYVPSVTSGGVTVEATPKFVNEGRYIQLTYTLKASSPKTTNFSIAADVMIGNDDNAPITAFQDGSGFKMVNRNTQAQFNFYGKNVYGATPGISTHWFGYYNNRDSYRYTQTTMMSLRDTDSAMACSWKNIQATPAGTPLSIIIGTGEANTAPEVGEIVIPDDTEIIPGKDVTVNVPIENATGDNAASKVKLYYSLLKPDGTLIDGPNHISDVKTNVSGAITNFVATFQIPNFMPSGPFILRVFAMNEKGGISAEVSKELSATAQPIKITSTSGDLTTTIGSTKKLSVTLTSSSTSDNPLVYQWQKQEGSSYVDITNATSDSYQVPTDAIGMNNYRIKVRYKNDSSSSVYSTAMSVTVNRVQSTTTISSSFDDATGNLTMIAKVSPQGGQSAQGNKVNFYNGSLLLGSANVNSGVATLVIPKTDLQSGPYALQAVYSGNTMVYSSSSSSQSLNINLKMQVFYDQFIQAGDTGVIRSYKEGIETILKDPVLKREGFVFAGWLSATGEIIDRITKNSRGDVHLTSNWKKTSFEVTIDDNLGSASITSSHTSKKAVELTAPEKEHYTFYKWISNDASLIVGKETNKTLQFTMPEKDVSLVAQYRNTDYSISYSGIDSQANWPTSYTYGSEKSLPTPSKAGAIFLGWRKNSTSGEIVKSISASDSGTITLYPAWSQLYQLTMKNNIQGNNQTPVSAMYPQGEEVLLPASNLSGYTFKNWRVVSGSLTLEDPQAETLSFTMPAQAIELEAVYEPVSYQVTYHLDGGTNHANNQSTYTYGTRIDLLAPSKTGYRFDGWFSNDTLTNAKTAITESDNGNITLYAKWSKNVHLLSLSEAKVDGSQTSKSVGYNDTVVIQADEKIGYTFTGWHSQLVITDLGNGKAEFKMPNQPVQIKALYEKTRYTIKYLDVDGSAADGVDLDDAIQYPTSYVLGYEWTLKNPNKIGYEFAGWFSDMNLNSPFNKISATQTGDVKAYAKWSINSYDITLDQGQFSDAQTTKSKVPYKSSLQIKANDIAGMQFIGWYNQEHKISDQANFTYEMPANNVVLQARYEPKSYTITYDLKASEYPDAVAVNPDEEKSIYTYGNNYTFAYPTLKNNSGVDVMTFDGWVLKGTNTKVTTITPTTLGNMELEATWATTSYKISYQGIEGATNANDLNMSNNGKYDTSGSAQTITLAQPQKVGYNFAGWTNDEGIVINNGTQMILQKGFAGDITLTATWTEASVSFTIDGKTSQAKLGDNVEVKLNNLANGYAFVNWQVAGSARLLDASAQTTSFVMDASLFDKIKKDEPLNISAKTKEASYSITYTNMQDAINNSPTTYTYGTGATLINPVRVGYTFAGWSASGVSLEGNTIKAEQFGDISLGATWTAIDYQVEVENGTASIDRNTRSTLSNANIGDSITLVATQKNGYTFAGWSLLEGDISFAGDQAATTTFTMSAGNVKVKANYALTSNTLTYMDGNNTIVSENPANYTIEDETFELANAKKDGYDFMGWYLASDFSGNAITKIEKGSFQNHTLYAKFERLHNTITFEQSGLGSYAVSVNGNVQQIDNNRFSTQDRGLSVRIRVTPEPGYEVAKILVNGEEYDSNSDLRFDDFFGNYTIKVVFTGAPSITPPTSGDHELNWSEGTQGSSIVDEYTKDEVVITTTPTTGTTTTYQVVHAGDALNDSKWLPYDTETNIQLKEEGRYIVYIRSQDGDGNTSILHTNIIVIDKTAPIIKDVNGNALSDQSIIYTDQTYTIDDVNPDKITINGSNVNGILLTGDQRKSYTVVVQDKAGNKTTITVNAKKIEDLPAIDAIKDITQNNVKSKDEQALKDAIKAFDGLHASGAQLAKINALKKQYQGHLTYLGELKQTLDRIENLANEDGWNSEKEQAMKDALKQLEAIMKKDNLSSEERASCEQAIIYLEDKLALVTIDKGMSSLDTTTQDNVKTKQEEAINEILNDIKDVLENGNTQLKEEADKAKLEESKEILTNLKDIITDILEDLDTVKDTIKDQDLSKPIDSTILDTIKDIIADLVNGNHMDDKETKYLEDANKVIDINEALQDINKYNPDKVTTSDREDLHKLIDLINEAMKDNSAITDNKLDEVSNIKDKVQNLVDIVDDVYDKLNTIKDVIGSDLSKPIEEERINNAIKDAQDLIKSPNVLPEEKDYVKNSESVLDILKELEGLKDITSDNVGIDQEEALKTILDRLEKEKNNPILDKAKWDELHANASTIEQLVEHIKKVNEEGKHIASIQANKDSNDVTILDAYIKALQAYLDAYSGNLNKDTLASLQKDLENAIKKFDLLSRRDQVSWNEEEVAIQGLHGLKFDKDVVVKVLKEKNLLAKDYLTLCNKHLEALKPGYAFDEIYNINLLLKDKKYNFDGFVQVRIKLSEAQLVLSNIGVVYIDDDGNVEEIKSYLEDGYLVFEVTHFSRYAIIYKGEKTDADKDLEEIIKDAGSPTFHVQNDVMLIAFISMTIIGFKKRKTSKQK